MIGAIALLNAGQLGQGHSAIGRLQKNLTQPLQRPGTFRQAHHQTESPVALHDLGHLLAFNQTLQGRENLGHGHAILRCRRVIDPDRDLRGQHLLFYFQIGQPGNGGQSPPQHLGLPSQGIQIVAKQLDGDLGTHAREHVVDPVRNGLANGNSRWQIGQTAADVALNLGHAALQLGRGQQAHIQLTHMDAFRVLIELGPSAAPPDMGDLGHGANQHLSLAGQCRRLGQCHPRVEPHAHQQRALVERRQERGRKKGHGNHREHKRHPAHGDGGLGAVEYRLQAGAVVRLQPGHHPGVAMVQVLHVGQQIKRQHGGDCDRHQQGGQRGHDEGHPQRYKKTPFNARQGKQRQKHQHDDGRGIHNARAHLHGGHFDNLDGMQALVGMLLAVDF